MRKVMISGEFNIENVENSENVQNTQKYVMPKRAQERLDALKAAGIDTSNLFAGECAGSYQARKQRCLVPKVWLLLIKRK